jgi:hypothetical protein
MSGCNHYLFHALPAEFTRPPRKIKPDFPPEMKDLSSADWAIFSSADCPWVTAGALYFYQLPAFTTALITKA